MITFFPQPLQWWVLAVGMICSAHAFAQAPAINCPANTVTIGDISDNHPQLWNAPIWWDANNQNHDLGDAETVLSITATPHCNSGTNLHFRYILSLDLDQNSIPETFIDSDSLPDNNKVYFGNNLNQPFSGTAAPFDQRPVNAVEKWGFSIAVTTDSTGSQAKVIWENTLLQSVTPQLPYGNHHIQWIVTDACGQSSTCGSSFEIKDTQKPTVTCIGSITAGIMNIQPGMVQLWASDFLLSASDNYTTLQHLRIGIRRKGTGTGFPYDPTGLPEVGLTFTCVDLGVQEVELWLIDKQGNTDFCEIQVFIQPNEVCDCFPMSFGGAVTNYNGEGISGVNFEIDGNINGVPVINQMTASSNSEGIYMLNLFNTFPASSSATVTPVLDLDPLNGVNTWDLVLISKHILGLTPLNTPYKLISADANRSGTVTTFDVVELRKLILGTYTEFPNNRSWRFIDKAQTVSDPANPFADSLRERSSFFDYTNNNNRIDYIGCKIGDVDGTALPSFWEQGTEDRFYDVSSFLIKDQKVETGQTFTVHVQSPEDLEGVQLTLAAKGLRLNHVIPGPTVDENNFGVFPGENTDGFVPVLTAAFENGPVTFDLEFTALTDGNLRDLLAINSDITPAIGFVKNGNRQDIGLQFIQNNSETASVLYQNTPNPWTTSTQIPFYLPHAAGVELTISDINGRAVYHTAFDAEKGHHQHTILKNDLPAAGMYYYQLRTGGNTYTKKLSFTF